MTVGWKRTTTLEELDVVSEVVREEESVTVEGDQRVLIL